MKNLILEHPLLKKRRKELQENIKDIEALGFDPHTFCSMPFVNIILEPDGSVGFCRHKGTDHRLGNLRDHTWKEIWNGEAVKKWRKEFLDSNPKTCTQEIKDIGCNLCPELAKLSPHSKEDYHVEMNRPLRLTANLNGQCNLQCQMCDVWQLPNGYYQEDNFWSPARSELFPFLKEIDLLSGEPLIQQDTFRLIDEVSELNPDCLWSITTNAHWSFNQKRKDYLNKISIKNLILSVDSLNPDVYAKIRKPGNLSVVLKTIEDLVHYDKERIETGLGSMNMNLNFLIQKDNWTEAAEVIHFCLKRNIHPFITFCYTPSEYSLLDLSEEKRIEILHYYLNTLNWGELTLIKRITAPLIHSLPKMAKYEALTALEKKKIKYENTLNTF
ncbi:MAG: hypothetical protein CME60_09925 [Halobacteriovoraceae bacterium]|nr:hypothetical protein [Halobacteriovoraceae bacterium]|tara:strand:+ start:161 stop:1315 length:1155 start_codon:yes stop_codon:yes gene_type:complete